MRDKGVVESRGGLIAEETDGNGTGRALFFDACEELRYVGVRVGRDDALRRTE